MAGMWERGALECPRGEEATCRACGGSLGEACGDAGCPQPPDWGSRGKPALLDSRGPTRGGGEGGKGEGTPFRA